MDTLCALKFMSQTRHLTVVVYTRVNTNYRNRNNKCVDAPYCRAEKYAGRVACYPLVSHDEYADARRDRQTDGRQSVTLCFLRAALQPRLALCAHNVPASVRFTQRYVQYLTT